jgi:phosphoglycerol transferase MdoB-like AlkP superfamily enzyme
MIKALVKLILFWLLFFLAQRLLFLAINYDSIHFGFTEIFTSSIKAFSMDLATSLYLIALPTLLYIVHGYDKSFTSIFRIINIYQLIMIALCCMIAMGDAGIYKVWGTKLNGKALSYLAYPKEVVPTLFAIENIGLMLMMLITTVCMMKLYAYFHTGYIMQQQKPIKHAAISVLFIASSIIGIRGGLQPVPLNRNWVFHSSHAVLNYASLNGTWNFIELITKNADDDNNPYRYFDEETARELFKQAHLTLKDSTIRITDIAKPNIVLIFLESWNPDVMACYGGDSDVTPKFSELANEGILFKNFYATGYRTEQGLLATLSAYPAQPVSSIIQSFGKFDKLPNIIRTFNNEGYHTSFFTGGRLYFDNIEAYLRSAGIQKIMGEDDFDIKRRTVWGAYDEETFALQLRELKQVKEPFFSALTTITTHEWFDADVPKHFEEGDDRVGNNYRNTMYYADSCLYAYLQTAKNESWYNQTLFVLVADHSSTFPYERSHHETERHHIPMLITGGALKKALRGTVSEKVGMHTDIAATVLAQCGIKDSSFVRSKNLFNPFAPAFAYYAFDNGFGWITKDHTVVYDHNMQKELLNQNNDTSARVFINFGKAYLQTNYQENIDYAQRTRR